MMREHNWSRASYNSGRDADTMLLEKLIPQHDTSTFTNMIQECGSFVRRAQELGLSRSAADGASSMIIPWTVKGAHLEPSFYTIEFNSPVVRYVPHAFSSLRLRRRYSPRQTVEYIPSYVLNLNRVVLSKSYLGWNSPNIYDSIGDGLFNRFDFEGGRRLTLSSTNILLPWNSKPRVQRSLHGIIRKCFEHCWWHPPPPDGWKDMSCVHNMIYHTGKRVDSIIQLRKTLVRIIKMRGSETTNFISGGKDVVKCVSADVALLVDDGENIFSERRRMLMTESLSSLVTEGAVINAIIAIQNINNPKVSMIIGHAAESMHQTDMLPVVSLSMWKILQQLSNDSSLTFVADIGTIFDRVSSILENSTVGSGVFYPDFMWRFTRNDAERMVTSLFPLYVRDGSSVYQMPPAAISFLAESAPHMLSKENSVKAILKLLDLVSVDARRWGGYAQSSLEAGANIGAPASSWLARFLSGIPAIAAQAALSKMFSKHAVVPPSG